MGKKLQGVRDNCWLIVVAVVLSIVVLFAFSHECNLRQWIAETNTKIAAMDAMTPQAYHQEARRKLLALRADLEKELNSYPAWMR